MKIVQNTAFGETRLAVLDSDGPREIIIRRDLTLNFGDVVTAKITAFNPVLKGYFAQSDRGALFLPTSQPLTEGQTVRAQITKEVRPGKDATARLAAEDTDSPLPKGTDIPADEMDDLIETAMQARIVRPDGSALTIERTSVCWTVDVDSGKSDRRLTDINLALIPDIVRQITLKNMGGLILIDLAGSKRGSDRQNLMRAFETSLAADSLTSRIRWTPAGLLEIERRRERTDLWTNCAPDNPIAVYYRIRRALARCRSARLTVRSAPEVHRLLQQSDCRAKSEPLFDHPIRYFEIQEDTL